MDYEAGAPVNCVTWSKSSLVVGCQVVIMIVMMIMIMTMTGRVSPHPRWRGDHSDQEQQQSRAVWAPCGEAGSGGGQVMEPSHWLTFISYWPLIGQLVSH